MSLRNRMPYNVCFHDYDATQCERKWTKRKLVRLWDVSKTVRYVLAVYTLAYSVTLSFVVWGFWFCVCVTVFFVSFSVFILLWDCIWCKVCITNTVDTRAVVYTSKHHSSSRKRRRRRGRKKKRGNPWHRNSFVKLEFVLVFFPLQYHALCCVRNDTSSHFQ